MTNILTDFTKVIHDFLNDLLITFPDKLSNTLDENLKIIINEDIYQNVKYSSNYEEKDESEESGEKDESEESGEKNVSEESGEKDESEESEKRTILNDASTKVHNYCSQVLPERFFDILYKNIEIFENNEINTQFLPGIEFKELWLEDLTDTTRENIWKYLQLLLFSIITNVDSKTSFGNTAKLFEAINEDEFKEKLEETIKGFENIFDTSCNFSDLDYSNNNIPNPEDIHQHINNIMNGKLGKLAQELAEETAKDLNFEGENINDVKDVFQTLFKNPQKLMNLVKNVGDKLDKKMKSGDIKESELLEEASNMFNNMKNMPGMGDNNNMQDLFNNINIPNLMKNMGMMPNNAKFNQNAFSSMMEKNIQTSKMKERMRSKLEKNQENKNTKHSEHSEHSEHTEHPQPPSS